MGEGGFVPPLCSDRVCVAVCWIQSLSAVLQRFHITAKEEHDCPKGLLP